MRKKLALLSIVALGLSSPLALAGCGDGYGSDSGNSTPSATTPGTETTADCCSGPGGGYAGCSMQTPPDCQSSSG